MALLSIRSPTDHASPRYQFLRIFLGTTLTSRTARYKFAQIKLAFSYNMKAVLPQNALQADVQKQCRVDMSVQ